MPSVPCTICAMLPIKFPNRLKYLKQGTKFPGPFQPQDCLVLLRQLPDQNGTILRRIKIATVSNPIGTYLLEFKFAGREKIPAGIRHHRIKKSRFVAHDFIQGLVYTETGSIRTMGRHGLYYVRNR